MKKLFSILLSFILFFTFSATSQASDSGSNIMSDVIIEDLGNGYSLETYIEYPDMAIFSSNSTTGSKTSSIKNSSGTVVATFKLTASFTYSSSSVTCTSASYSTSVKKSGWSFEEASASKSGDTAYGNYTAVYKPFFITVEKITRTVTLKCDKNGKLS